MPLALVKPLPQHTKHERHPRPYATYYYGSPNDPLNQWSAVGRACSRQGAIVAAIRRILEGRARFAIIHGPDGVVEAQIRRANNRITTLGDL
jgi:hypothetical protein